jgi:hypothetical protein
VEFYFYHEEYFMGQPSIQVRANYVLKAPNFDAAYHLFITVDDGNGNVTYYRGGPAGKGGSSRGSSESTSGGSSRSSSGGSSGSSSGSSSGLSESDSTKLVTDYGPYIRKSIDYNKNALTIYQEEINPEYLSRVKNHLTSQMNLIQEAKINYFLTGPNSNSTVGTALRNMGVNIKIPKGIWVPGFDQQLIDQKGKRVATAIEESSTYVSQSVSNDRASDSTDVSEVVTLLKDNASEVKKQYGFDVTTNEGLGKAVMQYWKENNLDPKSLKEQLNLNDSEFETASKALADINAIQVTKTDQRSM